VVKIGVLGRGNVGSGLAQLFEQAGHEIQVSTRDTTAETAAFGDVVVLAVPAVASKEVLASAGSLEGKILVDATNPFGEDAATNAEVVKAAPGARVVKAFNALFASTYGALADVDRPASLVYCGDDPEAKETVAGLIRDVGLDPVDAGGLELASNLEAFALMIVNIAYVQGRGPFVYRFEAP
jgi:8-hydroxy-5-deazaflavin:NADPH oxidoreductase